VYECGYFKGRSVPRPRDYRTITARDLQTARQVTGMGTACQDHFGYA